MMSDSSNAKLIGAYTLFVLAFFVYLAGISPTIYWRDSSELVTVVDGLGISHPAGSPTYSLVANLLTFLPVGSIAFRVNLFSALMGALAVSLLFVLLYSILEQSRLWMRLVAAASGACFLMVSYSFWRFAEVAEVYTLQNVIILTLLGILMSARRMRLLAEPIAPHRYYIFAFLYGLSAGIHATMAVFAPAFLVLMWGSSPRMLRPRQLAFLAFFFLFGFAGYLYLPIRSVTNPAFDWGDPQTWRQFLIHLLDQKDSNSHMYFPWAKLPYQMQSYGQNLLTEFSLLGVLLGVIGCVRAFTLDKLLGGTLLLVYLGNVGFFIRIWTAAFGFMPSFVIFAAWIGLGVHTCLAGLARLYTHHSIRLPQRLVQACFVGSVVVVLGISFVRHGAATDQSENYSAEQYGRQLLKQLPANAIVLSEYAWFPLQYLQHVEQRRADVTVILRAAITTPEYFTALSRSQFPHVQFSDSPHILRMATRDYFWYFTRLNEPTHPIFIEPEPVTGTLYPHLLPQGLLYRFHPSATPEVTQQTLDQHWRLLVDAADKIFQGRMDTESPRYFLSILVHLALYLRDGDLPEQAARTYQFGLRIQPDYYPLLMEYGKFLFAQRRYQQALAQFNAAYEAKPLGSSVNGMLGLYLLERGKYRRALRFLNRALRLGLVHGDSYSLLAEANIKLGRYAAAKRALQSALERYTKQMESQASDPGEDTTSSDLPDKIAWVRTNLERLNQGHNEPFVPLEEAVEDFPVTSSEPPAAK
jgi:tetratricopeptide (TPR) repeat protein